VAYLEVLAENLIPLVALALAGFLVTLLRAALRYVERKFDFTVDSQLEHRGEDLIRQAIAYADEWARNKAASGTDAAKPSGAAKLASALAFVTDQAEAAGMDAWLERQGTGLAKRIEAYLSDRREFVQ
jgi:hypothetical protein